MPIVSTAREAEAGRDLVSGGLVHAHVRHEAPLYRDAPELVAIAPALLLAGSQYEQQGE